MTAIEASVGVRGRGAVIDEDEGPAQPGAGRSGEREALVIGATVLALIVSLVAWATWPQSARPRRVAATSANHGLESGYVGSRSCGECHPGASAAHHGSGHARTFGPASQHPVARWLDGRSLPDPDQDGVQWSYSLRDGTLHARRAGDGPQPEPIQDEILEYALGSGRHAVTFVTRLETDPSRVRVREHRLTYFAHDEALDITPGQRAPYPQATTHALGRDFPTTLSLKCIECHVTRMSTEGPLQFDPATAIPNVDCERCHGPAGAHVVAARAGATELTMPHGLGRWTAAEQMRLCGACHRHPDVVPAEYLRADNPSLVRFQPVGLMQSACYTKSHGALSCVTCHDPHSRTSRDRTAYESSCRSCHDGANGHPPCPVSPRDGCLSCHMPSVEVVRGMHFTDHWIRIRNE
jgi:hypothetical protein